MNLVHRSLRHGGKIAPLIIPEKGKLGTGLTNPSIMIDWDGDILVVLRNVNYTLYHAENKQRFPSRWGPMLYIHPESDVALRTVNYLCRLNSSLEITDYTEIDTSLLDVPPLWEFSGQEDARIVRWDNELYLIGVRRDTTTNGQGRMEYSKIELDKEHWTAKEVSRHRIPAPGSDDSYCEKNWVPIVDSPWTFIKWASPVEIVWASPDEFKTDSLSIRQGAKPQLDQRGGSQVIRWGSMNVSFTHEVVFPANHLHQKDGKYRHRLCLWDDQMNLVGLSNVFSFLDANVEFCAGVALYEGGLLLTFGFQDNAAFALHVPGPVVEDLIVEALKYES